MICIGLFGAAVFALFSYVYWSTASYVLSRSDYVIAAEHVILQKAYDSAGRDGLIKAIEQRIAEERFEGGVYLLADPSFASIVGNLKTWPAALKGPTGWGNFGARDGKADAADRPRLRATFETLPDGSHLLVGKDIDDLDGFAQKIEIALAWAILLTFILAGVASVSVTRRTVGRIEAINATSRAIIQNGLGRRIPLHGTRDEWDQLAENLNLMLDRIEALMGEVKQVTDNVATGVVPLRTLRVKMTR